MSKSQKNSQKAENQYKYAQNKKNIYLANLSIHQVVNSPMLNYWDLLEGIAISNHLRCSFCANGCIGTSKDIRKAQEILINSIKYN